MILRTWTCIVLSSIVLLQLPLDPNLANNEDSDLLIPSAPVSVTVTWFALTDIFIKDEIDTCEQAGAEIVEVTSLLLIDYFKTNSRFLRAKIDTICSVKSDIVVCC